METKEDRMRLFPIQIMADNQQIKAKKLQLFDELCSTEITVRYI